MSGVFVRRLTGVVLALALWLAPPAAAQVPYHVFDNRTEVASLTIRFVSTRSFEAGELLEAMVIRPRGKLFGIRQTLSFLPLVSSPPPRPFAPLELQRDVARLRRFYEVSGFIGSRIGYEVSYRPAENRVAVEFIIDEGRPIILDTVEVALGDGDDPARVVPEEMTDAWQRYASRTDSAVGKRYQESEGARISGELLDWWLQRGWAFARVATTPVVDSTRAAVTLRLALDPGPRTRVDSIEVVGNESVSRRLILRTVPLSPGDWFSSTRLTAGQRRLFALGLFRLALTEVPRDQPRDSTVRIRVRLEEAPPRSVTGELGYVSAGGGLTTRGEFAHRNFTGGARTLRLNLVAQTGALALGERPERDLQASLAFREPIFLHRLASLSVSPYARYRDDLIDRSRELGIESSITYEYGSARFFTLQHRYSGRRVLDYRIGSGSAIDLATLLEQAARGALDSLGPRIERNTLSLSASLGRTNPTRRIRSLQVRPAVEVTVPAALNTVEFVGLDLPATGFYPLGPRSAVTARGRIGRIIPFGKTVRHDSIGPIERAQLRDVLLTAGGTGSVRGWGNTLLGPKQLNLLFETIAGGDSAIVTGTDGYLPVGGVARATGSVELQLPFPGLSPRWGTHIFLDGGRVWNADERFRSGNGADAERWFWGTGAGVDFMTLVGPIRVSVGYKLNPSALDLRSAADVFDALLDGRPISSVPADWRRRLHLHISLGQTF